MNRTLSFATLAVALTTSAAFAQAPSSLAPAAPTVPAGTPTAVAPQAIPAKVALIAFQEAVFSTNEGQTKMQEIQRKYEPTKAKLETLGNEVESLKKQLDTASATLSEDERASRVRTIDSKSKELQRDGEDAQTSYNADLQDTYNKLATKVYPIAQNYVQQNGFTLLLDVSQQQSAGLVMWAAQQTDVTKAVIDAYNTSSGVAAPPPAAPSSTPKRPATSTTPRPATAPKPATAK